MEEEIPEPDTIVGSRKHSRSSDLNRPLRKGGLKKPRANNSLGRNVRELLAKGKYHSRSAERVTQDPKIVRRMSHNGRDANIPSEFPGEHRSRMRSTTEHTRQQSIGECERSNTKLDIQANEDILQVHCP